MPITDHQEATIRRLKPQCGLDDATYRHLLSEDFGVHSARDLTPGLAEYFILTLRVLQAAKQDVRTLPNGTRMRWKCLICGGLLREIAVTCDGTDKLSDDLPQHCCGYTVHQHFLTESELNSEKIPY
jgi:hypothetical protein